MKILNLESVDEKTISAGERETLVYDVKRWNRKILTNRRMYNNVMVGSFYIDEFRELELFDFDDIPEIKYIILMEK